MAVIRQDFRIQPGYKQGYASREQESSYPHFWQDMTFACVPAFGPSRIMHDLTGRGDFVGLSTTGVDEFAKVNGVWRLYHDSTTDRTTMGPVDSIVPINNCTFVLGYEKADGTVRAAGAFGNSNTTVSHKCGALLPFSDQYVYFDFGGQTDGTTRVNTNTHGGGLQPTIGDDNWAFTTGSRGMEIWQNGIRIAHASGANPTRSASNGNMRWGSSGSSASDLAYYKYFYIFKRQLGTWEIEQLHREPFAPFMMNSWVTNSTVTIYNRSVTSTLAFTDDGEGNHPVSHDLGITDSHVQSGNFTKSVESTLGLSVSAAAPQFYTEVVSHDLSLTQFASNTVGLIDHDLNLSDEAVHLLAAGDFQPVAHDLGLTQTVFNGLFQVVEDPMTLTQTVRVSPIARDVTSVMTMFDSVTFCFGAPWEAIDIEDDLGFEQTLNKAETASVTSTLALTDDLHRTQYVVSDLNFVQTVTAGKGSELISELAFVQTINGSSEYTRSITHTDVVLQSMTFYTDGECVDKTYNDFSGEGQFGSFPMNHLTYDADFALESLSGDKTIVNLRSPETDDRRRIAFQRINRETLGGEITVYGDPTWPSINTLLFTIVALSDDKKGNCPNKIEEVMQFMEDNIGREIMIHDWEGITWKGIVTTPDEVATEDATGWWTFSFEFEGEPYDGPVGDQAMAITDSVVVNGIYNRSLSNNLELQDAVARSIYNLTVTDDLGLDDDVSGTHITALFADDFSGLVSTDLHGQSPDIGSGTWSAHTNYKADGSQTAIDSGAYFNVSFSDGNLYEVIWEPRTLAESAGLETTFFLGEGPNTIPDFTGQTAWGKTNPTTLKAGFVLRLVGATQANACRLGSLNDGEADTVNMTDATLRQEANDIDLRIVIDTRGGAGNWTATWYAKSTVASTWTLVRAEADLLAEDIGAVGWANNNATTTVTMNSLEINQLQEL